MLGVEQALEADEPSWSAEVSSDGDWQGAVRVDLVPFEETLVVALVDAGWAWAFDLTVEDVATPTRESVPGFGAGLGTLALGGTAAWLARRRNR